MFDELFERAAPHGPTVADELQVFNVETQPLQCWERPETPWPILYRAHDSARNRELRVWFSTYRIVRYTACGVWIECGEARDKFVNLRAERQWATVTKAEAIYSLKRRRSKQVQILTARLEDAENLLAYIEKIV